ncbi:MAG: hypothetical protein GJT30_15115 [Geobacter sp.]|nr:hypothetical protein [Geobacter sp.]
MGRKGAVVLEPYLLQLFILNWLLIIVDAAIGYLVSPLLARFGAVDTEPSPRTVQMIRRLLTLMVTLYMFFNCLAFFRGNNILLVIITGVVLLDIVTQLVLRYRMNRHK